MGSLEQREREETPIPGWPGMTEEALDREVEEIESNDFDISGGRWVIRVGDGPHRGDPPGPWRGSVRVTPEEYGELCREAEAEGVNVNVLVERQLADSRGG